MREHQIAISLKPQQFELLQRLARERGFKSVTAYVKQKIVELALGVDSELPAVGSETSQYSGGGGGTGGDLTVGNRALLVDLTRIHDELRGFVGHSLEDEIAAGVSSAVSSSATAFELPPPGQNVSGRDNGQTLSGLTPFSPSPQSSSSASSSPPSSFPSSNSGGAPTTTPGAEAVSSQVLPSNNLGGFGFKLGGFAAGGAASRFQAPLDNADRLSGYREIMDDLEELADRAFAISPRLGALDEEAPVEPATGSGGRSSRDSIFVEPILPGASSISPKSKAESPAVPNPNPINMVPPISAADLPGPSELAPAAPSVAPAAIVQAPPTQLANFSPLKKVGPASAVPTAQEVGPASAVPAAQDVGPTPAIPTAQDVRPTPAVPTAQDVRPTPAVPTAQEVPPAAEIPQVPEVTSAPEISPQGVKAPLPGDDLLSELLDESLLAHAEAPRPADNPFAVDLGFEKSRTESGAAIMDATTGAPPFVDPRDLAQELPVSEDNQAPTPAQTPALASVPTSAQALALASALASAQVPDQTSPPEHPSEHGRGRKLDHQPAEKPLQEPVPESAINPFPVDQGARAATEAYNDAQEEDQRQHQSQSGSQSVSRGQSNDEPQDPTATGHSNLSGGPPPKRRRT